MKTLVIFDTDAEAQELTELFGDIDTLDLEHWPNLKLSLLHRLFCPSPRAVVVHEMGSTPLSWRQDPRGALYGSQSVCRPPRPTRRGQRHSCRCLGKLRAIQAQGLPPTSKRLLPEAWMPMVWC